MEIQLDPASEVPIYQQLRDRVVEGIAAGALRPAEPLASVRQLAYDFGINAATVGKAYDMLRREGLVRTSRRSGSVVARGPEDAASDPDAFLADWVPRLTTLVAEAVAQGIPATVILDRVGDCLAVFGRPPHGAGARSGEPKENPK